jgi:hypothetical protein
LKTGKKGLVTMAKAGKKIAAKAQRRGIHHVAAMDARKKRVGGDAREDAFKAPGSMNKKKS